MPQGMGMRPMRPSSKITTKQWVQQSVDDKEKGGPLVQLAVVHVGVDGKRSVGAILRVAPLKEFEALTYFDRFAAQKWVVWA